MKYARNPELRLELALSQTPRALKQHHVEHEGSGTRISGYLFISTRHSAGINTAIVMATHMMFILIGYGENHG